MLGDVAERWHLVVFVFRDGGARSSGRRQVRRRVPEWPAHADVSTKAATEQIEGAVMDWLAGTPVGQRLEADDIVERDADRRERSAREPIAVVVDENDPAVHANC